MLSHAMLSKQPVRVHLGSFEYSQKSQKSEYSGTSPLQWTGNGTQTFDYNGRPHDADND